MSKELIRLTNCVMAFDDELALDSINLYINDKEFLTLLGPSGCGKTTTLRIIGGFLKPTSGDVLFGGVRINDVPPHKRQINTVFQKYALFPHLNVFENIAFGLRIAKTPQAEIKERVMEMLEIVSLKGFETRSVNILSGGQQQRVAIARALVNRPKVLLLDEPLGALDLRLRKDMQNELKRIQQQMGITFIYVTHDQEEALTMSDTVVVMDKGVIQQIGTPEAMDLLIDQKERGLVQAYVMDQIFEKLEGGEASIGPYYAGDYLTMVENNPNLRFCVPEEGSNIFVDAMCVPKGAENLDNAMAFLNFMCKPETIAKNSEVTGYSVPSRAAYALLDEDLQNSAVAYPPDAVIARCETFRLLGDETLALYDSEWTRLGMAKSGSK